MPEVNWIIRGSECLPIQLFNRLQTFEVIFSEGRVLLGDDFDIVRSHRVPAWAKQENKASLLERL